MIRIMLVRHLVMDYNNTFVSLNRFTPSHTDLSYIMLTVDPVTITVKDAQEILL